MKKLSIEKAFILTSDNEVGPIVDVEYVDPEHAHCRDSENQYHRVPVSRVFYIRDLPRLFQQETATPDEAIFIAALRKKSTEWFDHKVGEARMAGMKFILSPTGQKVSQGVEQASKRIGAAWRALKG